MLFFYKFIMLEYKLSLEKREDMQYALRILYEDNRDYFLASSFEELVIQIRWSNLPLVDIETASGLLKEIGLSYSFIVYALTKAKDEAYIRTEMSEVLEKTLHRDISFRKVEIDMYIRNLYGLIDDVFNNDSALNYSEIEDVIYTLKSNYRIYTNINDYFNGVWTDNELDIVQYFHSKDLRRYFIYQLQRSRIRLIDNLEWQLYDIKEDRSSPKEKKMFKSIQNRLSDMKEFITLTMDKNDLNEEVFDQFRKFLSIEYRIGG